MSRPMRNDTCWKAPSVLLSAESCMTGDRGAEPKVIDSETTVGIYSLSTHLPSSPPTSMPWPAKVVVVFTVAIHCKRRRIGLAGPIDVTTVGGKEATHAKWTIWAGSP